MAAGPPGKDSLARRGQPHKDSIPMPKVVFVNEKKEIEVPEGANLRDAARQAGIPVNFQFGSACLGKLNCMGHGTCGTCKVLVKKGMENLSPPSRWERFRVGVMLASIGHEKEMRLACLTQVKGDCTIETNPPFNLSGENFWQKPYPNK
jgi:ferredoxin